MIFDKVFVRNSIRRQSMLAIYVTIDISDVTPMDAISFDVCLLNVAYMD